ncbi:AzlD domain-containing protein [Mangrovicoccus algicola]|uniref:AzlD domain-containing protein n=1 Tax=Mangrovicoccus algicola TaxID=2771008 RepID=A0A8J6YZA9_9RHOB|nr:AzlD domain-containing protein [Mangrovicoccus algicola]MBE3639439.1 AzlD domain-containing protein [Mangrovicoccus algicola]
MTPDAVTVWAVIAGLAIGTFVIRFSFLGLVGQRRFPEWALRMLRYTPMAVLPGLVAPLVLWPEATGGAPDPARLLAAAATVIAGIWTRSVLWSVAAGFGTLAAGLALFA